MSIGKKQMLIGSFISHNQGTGTMFTCWNEQGFNMVLIVLVSSPGVSLCLALNLLRK